MEAPSGQPRHWRWLIHLILLTAYPLVLGIVGALHHGESTQPMLPSDIKTLLKVLAGEATIFGIVFGIALLLSRPSREDLFRSSPTATRAARRMGSRCRRRIRRWSRRCWQKIAALAATPFPVRFIVQSGDAVTSGRDGSAWNVSFTPIIERLTRGAGVPYFSRSAITT